MTTPSEKLARLTDRLTQIGDMAVAFSGGVDSSVVVAAAMSAKIRRVIAVTADSPSLSEHQRQLAIDVAAEIGVQHQIIVTDEGEVEGYQRNDGRRCFYCKQTLYAAITAIAKNYPGMSLVSGTNADDLGDYRPGLEAGALASVHTPLADLGMTKADVRAVAGELGLSNRELPAAPCLASRLAYGVRVTPQRLEMVGQAEAFLRGLGFDELRVRYHDGPLARIEVPRDQLARLWELDRDQAVTRRMESIGFKFVTIDTRGFRSGNLNSVLVTIGQPGSQDIAS